MSTRYERFPLPPGMPGIDTHLYIPVETPEEAQPVSDHHLTPSHHHARPPRFGYRARMMDLADRRRRRDRAEAPAADLQDDDGDGMDITQALEAVPETGTLEALPPWDFAAPARHMPPGNGYRGQTLVDVTAHAPRRYVPSLTDPQADLGSCLIFRDTVRAVFVRQEEARGFRAPDVPWFERYAGLYRARTGLPVLDFGIADAARQAHEEAQAALEANIRGRIDRITAPVDMPESSDEDESPAEAEAERAA